jgi:hypothetical protein
MDCLLVLYEVLEKKVESGEKITAPPSEENQLVDYAVFLSDDPEDLLGLMLKLSIFHLAIDGTDEVHHE